MRSRRADNGGLAARRAVVRWAWRLFRKEWRQQILVLTLITVSVTAVVAGASAAYNLAPTAVGEFGTASHRLVIEGQDPRELQIELDAIEEWFGTTEMIPRWVPDIPGSVEAIELRAQLPDGAFGHPMLDLREGRYPAAQDEIAVTDEVAETFEVGVGDSLTLNGQDWRVVGLVENPLRLADEFAVVSPAYDDQPDEVAVLLDTTDDRVRERPDSGSGAGGWVEDRGTTEKGTAALAVYLVATVVLLLVALVSAAGFVVMAQRRQREIGLLAATGATDRHLRLVMVANGAAVGAIAALLGTVSGLLLWIVAAPHLETAAGQRIDHWAVPWWVVAPGVLLALATAIAASWWPARVVARLSITSALSARPPAPKPARRSTLFAGLLLGAGVGAIAWSNPDREPTKAEPLRDLVTTAGIVAVVLGVLFVCPMAVRLLGRIAGRFPVAARLALRDLARYQARSGAALGAMSLALGIPVAIIGIAAADEHRSDRGNLSDRQVKVFIGSPDSGPFVQDRTPEEIRDLESDVDRLADAVGAQTVIALDMAMDPRSEPPPGFDGREAIALGYRVDEDTWRDVTAYVATPELLGYHGIDLDSLDPDLDVLTTRPEELIFISTLTRAEPEPVVHRQHLDVTDYSSAPTTLLTSEAVSRRGWDRVRAGWLVESPVPLTDEQIAAAREIAAEAGLTIEARRGRGAGSVRTGATVAGMLVALAVVAMTVGLIRSEAAGDIRTLTATGATSTIRRRLTGWTAGALGLLCVVLGAAGAYLAMAAGYLRDLGAMSDVPVIELATMAIGVPLLAGGAGWLLGGREPTALYRTGAHLSSIVVVVALLATAACSGGSGGKEDETGRANPDDRAALPLQEWWESVGGSAEQQSEQERRVEQRIADCMRAKGFDYTPLEPHPGATLGSGADGPWNLPPDEFAERYGYGLFTIDDPSVVDPNGTRLAAMSEAERHAYEEAMHGAPEDSGEPADSGPAEPDDASSGPAEPDASDEPSGPAPAPDETDDDAGDAADEPAEDERSGSCVDDAWAVEVEGLLVSAEEFAGLQEEIDALAERTETDPRVEEATREWADCMADADGDYRDFASPDDALDSVLRHYTESQPQGAESVGLESIETNGVPVHRIRGIDVSAIPQDDLRDVQDYEVRVATADYRCRADYDDTRYEVQFEHEQEFLEDHREELERFSEAFAAASGEG